MLWPRYVVLPTNGNHSNTFNRSISCSIGICLCVNTRVQVSHGPQLRRTEQGCEALARFALSGMADPAPFLGKSCRLAVVVPMIVSSLWRFAPEYLRGDH